MKFFRIKNPAFLSGLWKSVGMSAAVVTAFSLSSCGGDPNSVTLEVKPELGDLENFITLDTKEAKLSLTEITDEGVPCIKLSSTIQFTVNKAVASNYSFGFNVEFLDKDMNVVSTLNAHYRIEDETDYDNGEYDNYLKTGNYRAVIDDTIKKSEWDANPDAKQTWERIRKEAKYLVLKPYWRDSKYVEYKGSEDAGDGDDTVVETDFDSDDVSVATGSEDWDKILDEYEAYCTKTATYAKKAMAGDMSAMTEYASLLESAQSLENKLNNAKGQLSAAQAARLSKIATKLAQSMM